MAGQFDKKGFGRVEGRMAVWAGRFFRHYIDYFLHL
jgi:hypothetical protein